ncbi:hypothetical protein BU183_15375 [Enterococcus faecium]|nr:hypothetical protein BU183_15375 [Enterococcus faecium]
MFVNVIIHMFFFKCKINVIILCSFFVTGKISREYLLNETKYFVLHFHITYILSFFLSKRDL